MTSPPPIRRQQEPDSTETNAVAATAIRFDRPLPPEVLQQARNDLAARDAILRPDLGEKMARRYASGALRVLSELMTNPAVHEETRRKAACNLFEYAYGKPATVLRLPEGSTGSPTIDGEIAQAEDAAQALFDLEQWASKPPEEWPEELRRQLGLGESGT